MRTTKKGNMTIASAAAVAFLAIASSIFGFFNKHDTAVITDNNIRTTTVHDNNDVKGELEVHFIDVGQGDATLIKYNDHAMLIDAGDNSKGSAVRKYLLDNDVSKLDIVVATHPDSDHIGGLDVIVYNFPCDMIIMPDYSKDTKTYKELIYNIEYKNYKITRPVSGTSYMLGDVKVTIIGPVKDDYGDNANNYSVVLKVDYGENSFLFTGDAGEESEKDILESKSDIKADVYKVAHHGSYTSNTYDYLCKVDPSYAVISCGKDNAYGHPHKVVTDRLEKLKINILRTDLSGTIVAHSDGRNITWTTEK